MEMGRWAVDDRPYFPFRIQLYGVAAPQINLIYTTNDEE